MFAICCYVFQRFFILVTLSTPDKGILPVAAFWPSPAPDSVCAPGMFPPSAVHPPKKGDSQTDRQAERERERGDRQTETDRQRGRQTNRRTDRERERQTDRQADRQTLYRAL